jgi:hypothetical protein
MTIVPPFSSVMVALVAVWFGAPGQRGVGVAVLVTGGADRVGVGVGGAPALPHAVATTATTANAAAILTRW